MGGIMQFEQTRSASVLNDIRVLEISSGQTGRYAGRLLADMGAEVIKVDFAVDHGPIGIPELAYDTNKKSVSLDTQSDDFRDEFELLIKSADVVIVGGDYSDLLRLENWGFSFERMRAVNNRLITVAITPFGETGPYSRYNGLGIQAMAMSGLMMIQGDDQKAPVNAPGNQSYLMPDIHAVNGIFYALIARISNSTGQHVEVSQQEVLANIFFQVIRYSATGEISERIGAKSNLAPYNMYECKDGWVSLAVLFGPQAEKFFKWVGDSTLQDEFWYPLESRTGENMEFIDSIVRPFIKKFTVANFVKQAQELRLPASPLNTPGEFAENEQFEARDYFIDVRAEDNSEYRLPGPAFRMSETPLLISNPVPLNGQHNEIINQSNNASKRVRNSLSEDKIVNKPLEGIRVVDFTRVWAGPYSTRMLADYVAEVIKIESSLFDTDNRLGDVPYIADLNRNKLGITLDLHKEEAIEVVKKLVKESDVVIDNFALGVIERFGLSYEELKKINPEIIQVSMPGWGSVGPYKDHVAFGFNLVAVSGLSYLWGHSDSPLNARCKFDYPDFLVASLTTLGTLGALYYKKTYGIGQKVEVSQVEAVGNTLAEYFLDYFLNGEKGTPKGNKHSSYAPHGVYRCAGENQWCAIAVTNTAQWDTLFEAMGRPEWANDPKFRDEIYRKQNEELIDRNISSWAENMTKRQIFHVLQKVGVPSAPVLNSEDLFWDPHLRFRGYIVSMNHTDWGILEQPGITSRLSDTPGGSWEPSPSLGQHNMLVLKDILNMKDEEIEILKSSGALT
jgi:crotonobetainyl-CoA:carnitine CoA-transferase CaiB-like acyl-CoA transferase